MGKLETWLPHTHSGQSGFYLGMSFLGWEDGKGEVHPRLGPSPQEMLVCLYLSISIRQCLLAGKSFLNAIILNCNWETFFGGSWSVWGESFPLPQ